MLLNEGGTKQDLGWAGIIFELVTSFTSGSIDALEGLHCFVVVSGTSPMW